MLLQRAKTRFRRQRLLLDEGRLLLSAFRLAQGRIRLLLRGGGLLSARLGLQLRLADARSKLHALAFGLRGGFRDLRSRGLLSQRCALAGERGEIAGLGQAAAPCKNVVGTAQRHDSLIAIVECERISIGRDHLGLSSGDLR